MPVTLIPGNAVISILEVDMQKYVYSSQRNSALKLRWYDDDIESLATFMNHVQIPLCI